MSDVPEHLENIAYKSPEQLKEMGYGQPEHGEQATLQNYIDRGETIARLEAEVAAVKLENTKAFNETIPALVAKVKALEDVLEHIRLYHR